MHAGMSQRWSSAAGGLRIRSVPSSHAARPISHRCAGVAVSRDAAEFSEYAFVRMETLSHR